MYAVKIQMYNLRTFATEDDIGMSKHVLLNEKRLKIAVTLLFLRPFTTYSLFLSTLVSYECRPSPKFYLYELTKSNCLVCFETNIVFFYKGNQTCSRCHKLEKECNDLKKETERHKLERNKEKQALGIVKKRETKLKKANEDLQQKIENLTTEKNKIERQLRSNNKGIEKEPENTKDVRADHEKLRSEIKRLFTEHAISQSKCEKLDKEVKRYKSTVSRKY